MRIAIIGQQAFGASVFAAFRARGDDVAGVFCAPEKPGARPDPLRLAAAEAGVGVFQLPSLKGPEAERALSRPTSTNTGTILSGVRGSKTSPSTASS